MINLAVAVGTGGLQDQGASSTCQVSRTPPSLGPLVGIHPHDRALTLSLESEDFETLVLSVITSWWKWAISHRTRASILAPIICDAFFFLSSRGGGSFGSCHGDRRRNNPRFSRFSCIDERSKTEEKRKKKAIALSVRYLCTVACSLSSRNTSALG